jgi:AcrR family transcriptional regulator
MGQVKRAPKMRRAERRKQLLALASEIIATEGLAALTMVSLSERANVAKPVVYTHFTDRDAVAIALLEEHGKAIRAFFETRLSTAATLRDYIFAVVETSFAFGSINDIPVRKITNGFSAGDAVNQVFLREEADFTNHWRRLLLLLQVPRDRTEVVAHVLGGMINSAVYAFAHQQDAQLVKATLVELVLNTLGAFAPGAKGLEPILPNFREVVSQIYEMQARAEAPETQVRPQPL